MLWLACEVQPQKRSGRISDLEQVAERELPAAVGLFRLAVGETVVRRIAMIDKSPFNRRYATATFPGVYRGMNSTATGSGRSATCSRSDMRLERFCVSRILVHTFKVDISALDVRANQLHTELPADIRAFKTARQSSFNGRMKDADPCALFGRAGDDGIELLADPGLQQ